jgi:hypothetical protein
MRSELFSHVIAHFFDIEGNCTEVLETRSNTGCGAESVELHELQQDIKTGDCERGFRVISDNHNLNGDRIARSPGLNEPFAPNRRSKVESVLVRFFESSD